MMNWRNIRSLVTGKLGGYVESEKKHDFGWVFCDGKVIGKLKMSRGTGDLKPWELSNCARSIYLNDHQFKELERCNISREEFCKLIGTKSGSLWQR